MRIRRWRLEVFAGLTGLILAVAVWMWWLRLPMIVERQMTERLIAMGWEEPKLEVRRVGFRRLDMGRVSMVQGPWTVRLEQGTAAYRLKELRAGALRSLEMAGLRIDFDPRYFVSAPEAVRPELTGLQIRVSELLRRIPSRIISVSDGVLHIDDGAREATVSFSIHVTGTSGSEVMQSLVHDLGEQAEVRIRGVVEPGTGADLLVHLDVDQPDAWLAWAWPLPRPAGWTDATMDGIAATVEIQLPPGTGPIEVAGMIPQLRVSTGDGSATLLATSFDAQWQDDGLIDGGISIRQVIGRREGFGELHLAHLTGRVTDLLGRDVAADLAGHIQVMDSAHFVMLEPISFRMNARHAAETTNLEMRLDWVETPLRGPQLPEGLALSGDTSAVVIWHTNRTEWETEFELELSARSVDLMEGMTIFEPRVRLERPAGVAANVAVAARFDFDAESIIWAGIPIGNPHGSGEVVSGDQVVPVESPSSSGVLTEGDPGGEGSGTEREASFSGEVRRNLEEWMPNAAWLRGTATLGDAAFGYEMHLRQGTEWGDFEGEMKLEGVSLQQLALQLPQFAGTIEGTIDGRVAVGREAGEFGIRGGRLELDRVRAGRLRYPAEGLLTAGMPAGSEEYRRLALVEAGLKDLRLEVLTVELYDPEDPETPVKIRLEGTSVSEHAIVPIRFNLNLGGEVEPVLRLWQRGAVRIEGR